MSLAHDAADLASVRTGIEDLSGRVLAVADGYASGPDEDLASRLYEVERNLLAAARRLGGILKELDVR